MKYKPLWSHEVEERIQDEAKSLDEQTLPEGPPVMCTRCVVTNRRPRIEFDEEGVCSACRYADRKKNEIDWVERGKELVELLYKHHNKSGFNVVVPCSGGKDSSFVASTMRERRMTPLCATWAPYMYTDVGWRNIQGLVHSGYNVSMAFPDGLLHRKLTRLALEYYGDPFLPFIYGQLNWPMHVAAQNNIGLVFFGENGEAEYGGDPSANDRPCWEEKDWERIYQKGGGVDKLLALGLELGCISQEEIYSASPFYRPVQLGRGMDYEYRPEFHWLGYYLPWHSQANYYHAVEHTGFEANEERSEGTYSKYASIDDKLDGLHYYFAYLKFGIGRCTSDAAHEVRDGDLERAEALALVEKYDGEFPERYLQECLDYMGMTRDQLERVIERFRA